MELREGVEIVKILGEFEHWLRAGGKKATAPYISSARAFLKFMKERSANNIIPLPRREVPREQDDKVVMVSNPPPEILQEPEVFSTWRHRRERGFLKDEIARLDDAIRYRNRILDEVFDWIREGVVYGRWRTIGEINELALRIRGAINFEGGNDNGDQQNRSRHLGG